MADVVKFSPFRIPIWKRAGGGLLDSFGDVGRMIDKLQDLNLVKGRYVLSFDYTPSNPQLLTINDPIPFEILGKKAEIERAYVDPEAGRVMIQIRIIENPVGLVVAIVACGAAIGLAGYALAMALDRVDRVIVNATEGISILAVLAGAGYVVYRFILKRRL